jgi:hypothetical protein
MNDAAEGKNVRWHRQPLVWLIIAIPASAVIMGAAMLLISIRSFDGMVVDDYYRRGLEINRDLSRDHAAARRGLRAALVADPDARTLDVRVSAATGDAGALPAKITLLLVHPTRAGMDRSLTLKRMETGIYRGALAPLAPGRWHVRLETEGWRLVGRMPVPGSGRVDLAPSD